jgi:hypothetical protein
VTWAVIARNRPTGARLVPFRRAARDPLRAGKRLAAECSSEVAIRITYVRWRGQILGRKEYRLPFRFPVQIANASDRDPKYIPMVQALKPGWVRFLSGTPSMDFNWQTGYEVRAWVAQLQPLIISEAYALC